MDDRYEMYGQWEVWEFKNIATATGFEADKRANFGWVGNRARS